MARTRPKGGATSWWHRRAPALGLAGLVFIGISINLEADIAKAGLPARARQTIVVLADRSALSLAVLGPTDSRVGLGLEILVVGERVAGRHPHPSPPG